MQLLHGLKGKEKILEVETGSTKSHSVKNWAWKRLWTFHKTLPADEADIPTFFNCSHPDVLY